MQSSAPAECQGQILLRLKTRLSKIWTQKRTIKKIGSQDRIGNPHFLFRCEINNFTLSRATVDPDKIPRHPNNRSSLDDHPGLGAPHRIRLPNRTGYFFSIGLLDARDDGALIFLGGIQHQHIPTRAQTDHAARPSGQDCRRTIPRAQHGSLSKDLDRGSR